ncbi:hypothetical protein ACJX0J_030658, partial [Zea mays]
LCPTIVFRTIGELTTFYSQSYLKVKIEGKRKRKIKPTAYTIVIMAKLIRVRGGK